MATILTPAVGRADARQTCNQGLLFADDPTKQHKLGQFLTSRHVADFMASLLAARSREIDLLDAGAGAGSLSAAVVRRLCAERRKPKRVSIVAYELDPTLIEPLNATLADCQRHCRDAGFLFSATVHNEDFIAASAPTVRGGFFAPHLPHFNAAVVNPPYCKIRSDSGPRLLLRSAGIETSNLYSGFLALITKLLADGGELVAITPRSFCNGPYFKPFRVDFLQSMSLRRLHVFESRSAAFSGSGVLQENIIVHAVKGKPKPRFVIVSSSSGAPGAPVIQRKVVYQDVVSAGDPERFIHLVVHRSHSVARDWMSRLTTSLAELGLSVSTGRVVDFRAKQFLRQQPDAGTVPLIYPCHFRDGFVRWPRENWHKPNAIVSDEHTRDLLVPAGVFVLVKRFTAKEERRRVVACIYDPGQVQAAKVGFENHLDYFHMQGHGLPMALARGLAAFLNSTVVDVYFRQFSGHTQVNATDLRALRYPTMAALEGLGRRIDTPGMQQSELDALVQKELL